MFSWPHLVRWTTTMCAKNCGNFVYMNIKWLQFVLCNVGCAYGKRGTNGNSNITHYRKGPVNVALVSKCMRNIADSLLNPFFKQGVHSIRSECFISITAARKKTLDQSLLSSSTLMAISERFCHGDCIVCMCSFLYARLLLSKKSIFNLMQTTNFRRTPYEHKYIILYLKCANQKSENRFIYLLIRFFFYSHY